MEEERRFTVTLSRTRDYELVARFDQQDVAELLMDEPPPLGGGKGPNAARVLGAALGDCLASSLLFCLQRAHLEVAGIDARVHGTIVRNERGRLRIGALRVELDPRLAEGQPAERMARCTDVFEDFCIVTESVRAGIPVEVEVTGIAPGEGAG